MKRVEVSSYPVSIFIAGEVQPCEAVCREYFSRVGLCVTVTPTAYVYSNGMERGSIVGLINYGRFPSTPEALFEQAEQLALYLIKGLAQQSCSIQAPDKTVWISFRPADRDSNSDPQGEDAPAAECAASQSGGSEASASPNLGKITPSNDGGEGG